MSGSGSRISRGHMSRLRYQVGIRDQDQVRCQGRGTKQGSVISWGHIPGSGPGEGSGIGAVCILFRHQSSLQVRAGVRVRVGSDTPSAWRRPCS